jgi:hypothetical protein
VNLFFISPFKSFILQPVFIVNFLGPDGCKMKDLNGSSFNASETRVPPFCILLVVHISQPTQGLPEYSCVDLFFGHSGISRHLEGMFRSFYNL